MVILCVEDTDYHELQDRRLVALIEQTKKISELLHAVYADKRPTHPMMVDIQRRLESQIVQVKRWDETLKEHLRDKQKKVGK